MLNKFINSNLSTRKYIKKFYNFLFFQDKKIQKSKNQVVIFLPPPSSRYSTPARQ